MIGSPRVHHRITDSTNERAKALAAVGAPHGTLVSADEQTAGRGRQGRGWTAPPRAALLMSLLLRELKASDALLPLAAAVAVCECCQRMAGVACTIKWPNDVWVDERKLAGILVEGRPQEGWVAVGIGLNVSTEPGEFPEELRDTATSLLIAAGSNPPTTEEVLAAILSALDRRLGDEPAAILGAWRERDALLGRHVRWRDGEGTAAGIDETGALLVDADGGRVALHAGEVHLLRN